MGDSRSRVFCIGSGSRSGCAQRSSFFVRSRHRFSVPTWVLRGRRAQPRSRLAPAPSGATAARRRAAVLRAASTAPDLAGSGGGRSGGLAQRPGFVLGRRLRAYWPGGWAFVHSEPRARITLYPVERHGARNPNPSCTVEGVAQERWDPSERAALFGPRMSTVTHPSRRTRPTPPAQPCAAARRRAPLGTRPVSRKRHSATISLRASATTAVLRTSPLSTPTRLWNQRLNALSG
jgi:hypothetical protein